MRIAEIYKSVQGEGILTGTESVFIRTSGCNLRCWYCDTPHASWNPQGPHLDTQEILNKTSRLATQHVVITGGEPMLFQELIPLCEALSKEGHHITVETSGTRFVPIECNLMSISPKRANSSPPAQMAGTWLQRHERARHAPEVIRRLLSEYSYQLKFVIDQPHDCVDVEDYLREFAEIDRDRVMLMPQGCRQSDLTKIASWLKSYCSRSNLRYCPRKQIEWYGPSRGT